MKALPLALLTALALCVATGSPLGADPAKGRTIDSFSTLDPKTTKANRLVAKVDSTPEPQHRSGLEMVVDFVTPVAMPNFQKSFPAGLIDTRKYSGIRFFAKSDVATRFSVWLNPTDRLGAMNHPDGSPICFATGCAPASTWTEVILPFEKFLSIPKKEWKNGEQKVYQA